MWNQGEKFKIQIELTGPFKDYKFIKGFPEALQNVRTRENAKKTLFYYETTTAPLIEPIILQIKSQKESDDQVKQGPDN